jgi:hypothetical protein
VDSGNNMGADHGPRGGGYQRFLGDLLMWGGGLEGLGDILQQVAVRISPRAAEQRLLTVSTDEPTSIFWMHTVSHTEWSRHSHACLQPIDRR